MPASPVFTLTAAAAAGVILVAVAERLRVPSIALLLICGVALGPEGLGLIDPAALGSGLSLVVALAVAVILFEGGLTLDLRGLRNSPVVIGRMLTIGVVITWLGTAAATWHFFELSFPMALLCGSLVIVTGPTVIFPLLRRVPVKERVQQVLYWEAVLIDAVGVFIAVLCFEWLSPSGEYGAWSPVGRFALRLALGATVGISAGLLIAAALRYQLIPREKTNIFVLAIALLVYAVCDVILHESGILGVIAAGLAVGVIRPRQLEDVKRFKLELTELAIGVLFVLLAAKLRFEPFEALGWRLVAVVAIGVFVLRPLVIWTATWGRNFSLRERLFLSWMAPRGIVAASMASLFSLRLAEAYPAQAPILETFTFAVIGTTVIVQGLTAPWVARILEVSRTPRRTWLVIAEAPVANAVVGAMSDAGARAIAMTPDSHANARRSSTDAEVIRRNPLDRSLFDDPRFADVGGVVAFTHNPYYNQRVCERWAELIDPDDCYYWGNPHELDRAAGRHLGAQAWSFVDPHELATGVESGTLAVGAVEAPERGDDERFGDNLMPLFRVNGAGASIVEAATSEAAAGGTIVAVRRRVPGLANLVGDAVVMTEPGPDLTNVVRRLLERAGQSANELPVGELLERVVDREQSMPTALGSGVAIPHAYHESVDRPQCYVANVPAGVRFSDPDAPPVRLVFLVLSPVGQAEDHLRSLAAIAHLANDPAYIKLLERQQSAPRLLARVRERA
jgi:NhaP-type Na+/H+ or K+/H+ antiporter/mannitol/fructose-specific phosphotransferase system IIA component (Ntr-type)